MLHSLHASLRVTLFCTSRRHLVSASVKSSTAGSGVGDGQGIAEAVGQLRAGRTTSFHPCLVDHYGVLPNACDLLSR